MRRFDVSGEIHRKDELMEKEIDVLEMFGMHGPIQVGSAKFTEIAEKAMEKWPEMEFLNQSFGSIDWSDMNDFLPNKEYFFEQEIKNWVDGYYRELCSREWQAELEAAGQ